MWSESLWKKATGQVYDYRLLKSDIQLEEEHDDQLSIESHSERTQRRCTSPLLVSILLLIIVILLAYSKLHQEHAPDGLSIAQDLCQHPSIRKEWRNLAGSEQETYLAAVQCLMAEPSSVLPGTSLYDDFSYLHAKMGGYVHYKAAFLPWHRLYIHAWEAALKQKCGYNGALPYWDWTLDHDDLASSPVWDSIRGFGSNGVLRGDGKYCVVDGPFANTTRQWSSVYKNNSYGVESRPHCFSRQFKTGDAAAELQVDVSPTVMAATLHQPDYDSFFFEFETGPHNAIPQFIRGEFRTLTATNDPIFYLHHSQVDRIWWSWQLQDPDRRFEWYDDSLSNISLDLDALSLKGFAGERPVEDVMNTIGEYLCYMYE